MRVKLLNATESFNAVIAPRPDCICFFQAWICFDKLGRDSRRVSLMQLLELRIHFIYLWVFVHAGNLAKAYSLVKDFIFKNFDRFESCGTIPVISVWPWPARGELALS